MLHVLLFLRFSLLTQPQFCGYYHLAGEHSTHASPYLIEIVEHYYDTDYYQNHCAVVANYFFQ